MFLLTSATVIGLLSGNQALAQSAPDLPDDIFGEPIEDSAAEERQTLLAEEPETELPEEKRKKRVIQTLQRKDFMKIGRYEFAPHVGFVTNDPFVRRILFGAGLGYHITEVLGIEASGSFSPELGEGDTSADYKRITRQLLTVNQVSPDISKILAIANASFQFSPIYGKLAVGSSGIINFDIFGSFGTGIVLTRDDANAFGIENPDDDPDFDATDQQMHPTLNYGFGARVVLSEGFAIRVEGRGLSYIEVLESTSLEMKNNFTVLASASLFFPGMK